MKQEEINWNDVQWVRGKTRPDLIVLTTGNHSGSVFSGRCEPCDEYPDGDFSHSWTKDGFKLYDKEVEKPEQETDKFAEYLSRMIEVSREFGFETEKVIYQSVLQKYKSLLF